jgi:hypothetical protein
MHPETLVTPTTAGLTSAFGPEQTQTSGHFRPIPPNGRRVVLTRPSTHDGGVTSTSLRPQLGCAGSSRTDALSMSTFLISNLERFWPSRRGHAFDELCR